MGGRCRFRHKALARRAPDEMASHKVYTAFAGNQITGEIGRIQPHLAYNRPLITYQPFVVDLIGLSMAIGNNPLVYRAPCDWPIDAVTPVGRG